MNKRFVSLLALAAATLATTFAQADTVKAARSNDVATKYILKDNGDLFRVMKVTGLTCQVTSAVQDMKVSQHPNDAAMIYYIKDSNLYYLQNAEISYNCPKSIKKVLLQDIKRIDGKFKYGIVSSTKSDIVNVALTYNGKFVVWVDTRSLYTAYSVSNYKMNPCFGEAGKRFSRTSVILISRDGVVTRLEGKRSNSGDLSAETDHSRRYSNIEEFVRAKQMCKAN